MRGCVALLSLSSITPRGCVLACAQKMAAKQMLSDFERKTPGVAATAATAARHSPSTSLHLPVCVAAISPDSPPRANEDQTKASPASTKRCLGPVPSPLLALPLAQILLLPYVLPRLRSSSRKQRRGLIYRFRAPSPRRSRPSQRREGSTLCRPGAWAMLMASLLARGAGVGMHANEVVRQST
ncbi:hypothetical protein S7711_10520 [Stachybotrys chartarum IBT 7711]|uniref:Uncharacterized protein n=1 Tax=Stachybotrys chartarum (strain CBS 109288 / IBT 7711) TaxID=1280523 RepID=A0A084AJ70_STACB|nr:hypothetical protein S7711_10520 [Stachybotrys chartarum IBT 7711]